MSPLGLLNFVVLQWFGVRLARCSCWMPTAVSIERLRWWGLMFPVVPLTGWWSRFVPLHPKIRARFGDYPSRGDRR